MDLNLAISIGGVVVSILGSYFALKHGVDESLRTIKALHERFDKFERDFHEVDKELAMVKQRQEDMREEFAARFRHEMNNTVSAFNQLKELVLEERGDRGR